MAKKSSSGFTLESKRFCAVCDKDIAIGTGGETNWNRHLNGKAHAAATKKPKQPSKFMKLTSWITGGTSKGTLKSATTPSTEPVKPSAPDPDVMTQSPSTTSLLDMLRVKSLQLPEAVPLATNDDPIARFNGSPKDFVPDGEDAWEHLDPILNNFVGYGMDTEDVARLVRRGELGMNGLCRWLAECVSGLGVPEVLLEGKVQRLLDACDRLTPTGSSPEAARITAVNADTSVMVRSKEVINVDTFERPCQGYHLKTPPGLQPLMHYPLSIHSRNSVPWTLSFLDGKIILRSTSCTGSTFGMRNCPFCKALHHNSMVEGLRDRMVDGAAEKTPWAYLSMAQVLDLLECKNKQLDMHRLKGLNVSRRLVTRARHMEGWKRLVRAISVNDTPRLQTTLRVSFHAGSGFRGLLAMLDNAAQHVYRPRSYQEADYHRAFLVWKLGGAAAARIAYHSLGIPSIDATSKHIMSSPIRASAGFPVERETLYNLSTALAGLSIPDDIILGFSVPVDEIKSQERLRWEQATNKILGLCREHCGDCCLDFQSIAQADYILTQLQERSVHLASESTVVAMSVLSKDPRHYTARPFLISGSCKRETVESQTKLLALSVNSLQASPAIPPNLRLYCIATDGDSRRRRALLPLTFTAPLSPKSLIFPLLSPLRLFNLVCGAGDVTMDFDYKHTAKRFRNTLIRIKGIQVNGVSITPSVVKHHLTLDGMSSDTADALLTPNDKQDVGLMYRLLYQVAGLSPPSDDLSPTSCTSRRVLHLLGQLYRLLLDPYSDITLSLHDQLLKLSAAAHLILALYAQERGNIMPVQLCFDVLAAIKNVYFSVAKAKIHNPDGEFYLILLGTDSLEKVFGKVRTMIGTDSNADQLQLANRIDAAVQCVKILEQHPEWGGEARRLRLKPRQTQDGDTVSPLLDHINPRTWQGNVSVGGAVLLTAWQQGRQQAEKILKDAGLTPPFDIMEAGTGYNMLCPFGDDKPILIGGGLHAGEREEDEDEADIPPLLDPSPPSSSSQSGIDADDLLDADDLAATEAVIIDSVQPSKPNAFVSFDEKSKPIHKGSVLRIYSDPFSITNSRDRLKRVRGLAQFNERPTASGVDLQDLEDAQAVVAVEDPVATIVRCNNLVFVAILEVTSIRVDSVSVQSLAANRIHEPNIHFRGRIMTLVPRDSSHQPSSPDWEWNGRCVKAQDLDDIDGALIELVNPTLKPALCDDYKNSETVTFCTSELLAVGALLLERSVDISHRLRTTSVCPEFPYRNADDEACLLCETEASERGIQPVHERCPRCPSFRTVGITGPTLVKHMSSHILHDPQLKGADHPCGFCLRMGTSCAIYLKKRRDGYQINTQISRCMNLRPLNLKPAASLSKRSPCTNHPLVCPLCPSTAPAVWKYSLKEHLQSQHPSATLTLYEHLYKLDPAEPILMKHEWNQRKRITKRKKVPQVALKLSEFHTTSATPRPLPADTDGSNENGPGSEPGLSDDSDPGSDTESDDGTGWESATNTTGSESSAEDEDVMAVEEGAASTDVTKDSLLPDIARNDSDVTEDAPPTSVQAGTPRYNTRKRQRTTAVHAEDSSICADPECFVSTGCNVGIDSVKCDGPQCDQTFHLACLGLLEMPPQGGWFCDDDCRSNAGFRVAKKRRQSRK